MFRPTILKKNIPVYPPLTQTNTKPVLDIYKEQCFEKLDPEGWRRALLKFKSPTEIKTGDVIRVVYNTRAIPPFMGQIIGISRGGVEASVVLRNNITKLGVEMRIKIFSPLISRIDIVKKPLKRKPGRKHYFIKGTKLDVKDLEADLKKSRRKNKSF
ncbi:50S ribosomal protein L19 [Wickerhamomyces ciferrii]|uniref:50S ribosomal protein L19 n=1 Tax=Wickerhamomyces ciferrii (strain ATCC 14091 / BCRC 22168 / CBS 111 / JCM 3599 / NBRC 0793 / NRRL Y-1031 F-60-10) TaxID=1206466 RepID=K0KCJ4_WICCF|nr:50S ribosomal protein L19 [Wickerhamomyces ciferrii]CCH42775.1 50S ribosomal protein L19 [Wickerhamomyces ciferrii]